MSALAIALILIGVGYSATLLTRFLVWLDTPKDKGRTKKNSRNALTNPVP